MKFIENIKMALISIMANKMRSFLTMLGIIIGISSVITIVSLGQGGQKAITGEFEKIGASTININVEGNNVEFRDYITLEDVKHIKERVDTVQYISPTVQKRGVVISENQNRTAIISGGNTDLSYINNVNILYGRFFNEREYLEGRPVVVIDSNAAFSLFGYEDVVGNSIRIGNNATARKATIIGVVEGFSMPFRGGNPENMPVFATVPITFLNNLYPDNFIIETISIMATSQEEGETAGNAAVNILEARHNNRGRNLYQAENALAQLEQINTVLGIFTAFIGAVAAISLLVGGIGVMNIMLVSVTERTREIGIRKAVGATTRNILIQFLMESAIISLIGGIIGMILGIAGAQLIGMVADITPSVSIASIIGAIVFSSAVGIFFGIYPAKKAAALNPIDALRYE
ncbi:ABC transporter permease [Alkaliphilus hydrothermalis]|uniref:ABC transport system permease protein n=1 Tax=Alkaliphilus hydrothermalis TaxID=1482730 RepID=A0ABS2NT71_9FIRM|nr:ABC transporter permease [Alkaliphilus hydrothermalis]MBM7616106.1 putative ABC transport system permease protein [Alkaliphilus hydrothermalis]